ncbi:MAG: hypothetical protein NTX64_18830 [Elusimicrobia bacterium]|nr:hypothetical protein [Elusimicrobiota bacterium]
MLKLSGDAGEAFSLDIRSYQYPELTNADWDSEWLLVEGTVRQPKGQWEFYEPCLTTFELRSLGKWLRAVAGGEQPGEIHFTEPNLRFSCRDDSICVWCAHEAAPPWASENEKFGDGVCFIFPIGKNDVSAAAQAVETLVKEFPVRTKGPW